MTIGPTQVRNRSVFTAHGAFLDFYRLGQSPERYLAYQERRARGGNALAILQPVHVHPTSHGLGHFTYDPDDLGEKLTLMAERLHRHDTKVLLQLMHWGAEFVSDARRDLEPIWAFSEVATPTGGEATLTMTPDEIEEVHHRLRRDRADRCGRRAGRRRVPRRPRLPGPAVLQPLRQPS